MEGKNDPKDGKKMEQVTLEQAIADPSLLHEPCTLDLGGSVQVEINEVLAGIHEHFWYWLNELEGAEPNRVAWKIVRDLLNAWIIEARMKDNTPAGAMAATAVYASVMRGILREMKRAKECLEDAEED